MTPTGELQQFMNFADESPLITEMMSMVYNSMAIPGDINASQERSAPYYIIITDNLPLYKDRLKNILQFNAQFAIGTPDGSDVSFASQIIDKYKQVSQLEQLANLPGEQLNKIFGSVIAELVKQGAVLKSKGATNGDFLKYFFAVQEISKALEKIPMAPQAIGQLLDDDSKALQPLVEALQKAAMDAGVGQDEFVPMLQKLSNGGAPENDKEKAIAVVLALPFDGSVYETGTYPDEAGLKKRAGKVTGAIANAQQVQEAFGVDLNAQKNMLIQILLSFR
jgi:hypothetical protein